MTTPLTFYVDADSCPVKDEVYRVADRYRIKVFVVANSFIRVPRDMDVQLVVVSEGMDEADNWIAERADENAVVITQDIPLADRCVKAGSAVLSPKGKEFDENSIGMALATRNLKEDLRSFGELTGGPKPFSPRDRSDFLQALDRVVQRLKRAGRG
ncbi:YaiI/YqxD family protein [Rhodobacteraceae bacterium RKSG542]|uniref:YaiI/YqxD family protein n=1 Tax=Pseudovibrio flavus TaxID=2529854 RepID=UPI0012BC85B3|nr:YaiI/YqxD family protein [Pseudovibrio flavus]MTI17787.1 YaiI/YqxD family protein [Pseudovibrio flavus]